MDTKKSIVKWLVVGLFLRFLFMPFTVHPDIIYAHGLSHYLAYDGVLDIYKYASANNLCIGYRGSCYGYPPMTYYTLGAFQIVLKPLLGGAFPSWVSSLLTQGGVNAVEVVSTAPERIYSYLFLLKLPYLIFDLGIAFLLLKLFKDPSEGLTSFKLWMLNPLAIYSSFMLGQFDVIPTFFVVLSLYFLKERRFDAAVLSLGVGGSLKLFPFFFLLPIIILISAPLLKKIQWMVLGGLPYILFALPVLGSKVFLDSTLGAGEGWLLQMEMLSILRKVLGLVGISFSDSHFLARSPFLAAYALIIIYLYARRASIKLSPNVFAAILLVFYLTSEFNLHYLLWVTPLLIVFVTRNRGFVKHYALLVCSAVYFKALTWPTTSTQLFTPLNPDYFAGLPTVKDWLNQATPTFLPVNAGTTLMYVGWAAFNITCVYFIFHAGSQAKAKRR